MAEDLITVADAAVPFNYGALGNDVVAVLGYVGRSGYTPHVWSTAEADQARRAVGAWAPIWCPPQGEMNAADGAREADLCLGALSQYNVPKDSPVFYDIERGSFDASEMGARQAFDAFQVRLKNAGYSNIYAYAPVGFGVGIWAAHWVTVKPKQLIHDLIGQQYTDHGPNGSCDLSVFRRSVFAPILGKGKGDEMALDTADKRWILKQLETAQENILKRIGELHNGGGGKEPAYPKNVASTYDLVAALGKDQGSGATVDVVKLAHDIGHELGPTLADGVAAELAKRLST